MQRVGVEVNGARSAVAWAEFKARVTAQGGEVLELRWLGSLTAHRVRCAEGHEFGQLPNRLQRGHGLCRICACGSVRAEAAFRARLDELGATLLESRWLGSEVPHRVLCSAGHEGRPRPDEVKKGGGVCRVCAGRDPATAEAAFRTRLGEMGAALLESYKGAGKPHQIWCAAKHEYSATPSAVRDGGGACPVCAGRGPAQWAAFRARLVELGAELLEPAWLGGNKPHRARCAAGHDCSPRPGHVLAGIGICVVCAGKDRATAEAEFHARVADQGGEVLGTYVNISTPVLVRCPLGHECTPGPQRLRDGGAICPVCSLANRVNPRSAPAWEAFRGRIAELGGDVIEPEWLGAITPHRVLCAAGHETATTPANIQAGGGICRKCRGRTWDVFYVVRDPVSGGIKFGVTSGDPRPRLRVHRKRGYAERVLLFRDLPGDVALEIEQGVRATLRLAGIEPTEGREYFKDEALPIVLDIAENWPGLGGQASSGEPHAEVTRLKGPFAQDYLFDLAGAA